MPIVGAANATAVAGGFELLLGCDVVVRVGGGVVRGARGQAGLFAAGGGVFLSTRIPLAVALELTLTGDPIDAVRAQSLGLDQPGRRSRPRCSMPPWRSPSGSPATGRWRSQATKQMVRTASTDLERAKALAAEWQPKVFGSEDAKEGATAFIEKRDPVWKGR